MGTSTRTCNCSCTCMYITYASGVPTCHSYGTLAWIRIETKAAAANRTVCVVNKVCTMRCTENLKMCPNSCKLKAVSHQVGMIAALVSDGPISAGNAML